jgi:DNA-directed RNA polymerase specialized sigma24 family protein
MSQDHVLYPKQDPEFEQHDSTLMQSFTVSSSLSGLSPYDSDTDVEEILDQIDPYIVAQVEKIIGRNPYINHRELLDLEKAELAQIVRINLWHALQGKNIRNIKAYIRRIVHNEFVNLLRGREPLLPLPLTEDGELWEGNILVTPGEGMADTAFEVEEQEAVAQCTSEAAAAISTLPPRQKDAITALLHERLDNLILVVDSFRQFDIDVEAARWPEEEDEKRLLKASISAARHNVARLLDVDLKLYKQKGTSYFSSRMR